jgi:hypothetical protein
MRLIDRLERNRTMRVIRLDSKGGRKENRKRGGSGAGVLWTGLRPFMIGTVVFLALLFILFLSPWVFRKGVFVLNKTFVMRQLDVDGGETMSPALVRDLLAAGSGDNRIMIGMPLFGFDMEDTRREFLLRALNIKTLRMTRLLPDKLVVRVVERRPIMRIEPGGLVVDDEGVIFPRYVSVGGLPLLTGVDGIQASQGSALTGMARAAVFLITCLEKKPFQLPVTMIDAAMPDYLVLTLIDQKQVTIAWDGMLEKHGGSQEGVLDLLTKLSELSRAMNTPAGRSKRFWNATVKGRFTASE